MYNGLKKTGFKVVWSIRGFEMPEQDNENFWVSSWVPQIEVLAHPALKVGLTHCGFGGCLEFINAGVPVVAFPHFFDQPANAKLLIEQGAAVMLYENKMSVDPEKSTTVKKVVFSEDDVCYAFQEAVKLKGGMRKMQHLCHLTGGRDLAI